jgi:uncharacterized protein (TIGR02646 family)
VLFQRQQTPPPKKDYRKYKPFLRKDFQFRCAYCLIHEAHHEGMWSFHVDHFRPKSRREFKRLALIYTNLYYACNKCNTFKGDVWPTAKERKAGYRFIDPCEEDPYGKHIEVHEPDGSVRTHSRAGKYMAVHVRLDRGQLRRHRRRLIEAKEKCQGLRDLLEAPGLAADWIAKARKTIEEIERDYLNPSPPYELEDLER